MRIQFTLPSASIKNALLSFSMFLFFASFFSFHVYLRSLHKVSLLSHMGTPTALIEEFIAGAPKLGNSNSLPKPSLELFASTNAMSECTPFSEKYHFEPTTEYRNSLTLPQWMKDYFDWHREQTLKINKCNYKDFKYFILRCSDQERKCGGVADRLKSLPFFVAASAHSKRIFLIRWERPTKLEEFLIPNEINWAMPDWMYGHLRSYDENDKVIFMPTAKKIYSGLRRYAKNTILEGLLQDFYGGCSFYYRLDSDMDKNKEYNKTYAKIWDDFAGWRDYEFIFRDLFYSVFEPSPPVAKLVKEKMISVNLVPGKFSTSQYRAFYAIEHKKDMKQELELMQKSRNALNCASKLQPGDPIFFASDSQIAVKFAQNMSKTTGRKILTFDGENEALHLDKKYQWKSGNVSDFYPTFVDLLIMAEAKCMSLGVGGYGRFANLLSTDVSCVIRHDNENPRRAAICSWLDDAKDAREYW